MQYLVYVGAVMAVIGLLGLGYCIREAFVIRRAGGEGEEAKARLQRLVAINMASFLLSFLGLGVIVAGLLLLRAG